MLIWKISFKIKQNIRKKGANKSLKSLKFRFLHFESENSYKKNCKNAKDSKAFPISLFVVTPEQFRTLLMLLIPNKTYDQYLLE